MEKNKLYYGDNLDILKRYVKDESVDLIYLDPPFNSNQDYNAFLPEQNGKMSDAQIKAFEDTWHWNIGAEEAYEQAVFKGGKLSEVMQAFRKFLGENDMMAYLSMMAPRLKELHRVLKPTGSIYLHCDPTASHYLKILMDAIFGFDNFKNEISWKRSARRSAIFKIYRRAHDVLLFYVKSDQYRFNIVYGEKDDKLLNKYSQVDDRGKYQLVPLMASGRVTGGETGKPWRGFDPNTRGKSGMHWLTTHDKLEAYVQKGLVAFPKKPDGMPRLKYYLDQNKGIPLADFWGDIDLINSMGSEGLGYPTQKPEALLERILHASSNEGDIVLDPFCGCGTTIVTSQKLNRQWIGIDITHLSVSLMKYRLTDSFGQEIMENVDVIGEPTSLSGAKKLAFDDPWQFQWWILGLVGARPVEQKKGADKGIDGRLYFFETPDRMKGGEVKQIIFSVKSGKVNSAHIRELKGTVSRENAAIGVFLSLNHPSSQMKTEAATTGFYQAEGLDGYEGKKYAKIQIITAEDLLNGKQPDFPPFVRSGGDTTFKKSPRKEPVKKKSGPEQTKLEPPTE
jgi:DNA modification methylase